MKRIKKLTIPLTKKQIYSIREYVAKNGYRENCGRSFWLIAQPVVRAFNDHLDILLLTNEAGEKLAKVFKTLKLGEYSS